MTAAATALRPQVLRVAAVWGTTVLATKTLERGESFVLGEGAPQAVPMPDGVDMPKTPVRAAQGGWEIDARGTVSGILRLRGRDEDPVAVGRTGTAVAIMPGDYGLLQYGLFSIFFQYASPAEGIKHSFSTDILTALSIFSSIVFHIGAIGFIFVTNTPDPIPKPGELTTAEEFASRFNLHRAELETPPPPAAGDQSGGGSGVKDPGAHDKKPQGGGKKIAGAEGKLGLNGKESHTELQGEIKPAAALGGLQRGPQRRDRRADQIHAPDDQHGRERSQRAQLGEHRSRERLGDVAQRGRCRRRRDGGRGRVRLGHAQHGRGSRKRGRVRLRRRRARRTCGSEGNGRGGNGGGTGTGSWGPGAGPGEAKVSAGNGMAARGGLQLGSGAARGRRPHRGDCALATRARRKRNPTLKGGIVLSGRSRHRRFRQLRQRSWEHDAQQCPRRRVHSSASSGGGTSRRRSLRRSFRASHSASRSDRPTLPSPRAGAHVRRFCPPAQADFA